jgi:hypothetical protein
LSSSFTIIYVISIFLALAFYCITAISSMYLEIYLFNVAILVEFIIDQPVLYAGID